MLGILVVQGHKVYSFSGYMSESVEKESQGLSIGALSQATGVPTNTLRTWERRYGYPAPERTSGGHRIYSTDHVEQLRLVTDALERGHRPANVLTISRAELVELLGLGAGTSREYNEALMESLPDELDTWIQAVQNLDERTLDLALRTSWNQLGGMRFISDRVGPFLTAVGHLWAEGTFSVLHEHFASERIRDFLSNEWRQMSDRAVGPSVFCTTLPKEAHSLGLHMVATVLALSGARIQYFGVNTPVEAIIDGVQQVSPSALILSVSQASEPKLVRKQLQELVQNVAGSVPIVVGGQGTPDNVDGIVEINDFSDMQRWAADSLLKLPDE
jgi:DNA-binding transcriptional MerR regulator/methylmalonyl-CoA mutase cobalamin-binding subunit